MVGVREPSILKRAKNGGTTMLDMTIDELNSKPSLLDDIFKTFYKQNINKQIQS